MTAALLQGVPSTTLDTDIWIDLPEREYIKVMTLCQKLGASLLAKTVVELIDGLLINFLYRVDGVGSFSSELKKSKRMKVHGVAVNIINLKSILKSKLFLRREKDLAHIPILKATLHAMKKTKNTKKNRPYLYP